MKKNESVDKSVIRVFQNETDIHVCDIINI